MQFSLTVRGLLILLLFFFCLPVSSVRAEAPPHATLHTTPRLFAVDRTGDQLRVGLHLALEDGWKTYWRVPGDAGLPPALDWQGSSNFKEATLYYPAPHRYTIFGLDNIGYKESVTFPIDVRLTDAAAPATLALKLDILVCSDVCIPETHRLTLDVPVAVSSAPDDRALYEAALKRVPDRAADVKAGWMRFRQAFLDVDPENRLFLVVTAESGIAPDADSDLFIEHASSTAFGKPRITVDSKNMSLTLRVPVHSNETLDKVKTDLAASPMTLTFRSGDRAVEAVLPLSDMPVAPKLNDAMPARADLDLRIIFFAFLGGLILNLMPCVLPVLSLKILSVASHGGKESRREIFANFMASAAGILASFWLMAATVVGLKAVGNTVGWGIQFQHPAFLVFLIAVLLAFAVNMWGLFEIPLPRFIAKHGSRKSGDEPTMLGHFLTGAFATLLATPCTAPFLGTAVGFALAGSTLDIFAIFTFLGLGLAFPYILLALSPKLFKRLPKPGKWMVTLRRALALALLLTALWLMTVLSAVVTTRTLDIGWQTFDEALIATAVADGKTVIVDVTADWCLTCKANKRLVLEQSEVQAALAAENIVRLQADWTLRDEEIATYLRKYGRYGIPFNIVYGPEAPEGIVLPELLSKKAVMDALALAAGE